MSAENEKEKVQLKLPKVDGYKLLKAIGGGGFSTVYRAINFTTRKVAACKVVALRPETTRDDRRNLEKEIKVHSTLKHRNVLEFINAYVVEPNTKSGYFPAVYMLMELAAGGDLFDKIAPDVGVGEDVAHHYFTQLASGLAYIHGQGIVHRDLKPENILLDAAGTLKITDFGLSSIFRLQKTGKTRRLNERCGSLPYVAPEVCLLGLEIPYEAEPIDVWGIGVILFTLLSGNTPWDEPTEHTYEYQRYLSGECFDDDPWNRLGRDVLDLITGMLTPAPSKRMTLRDVFRHPWMQRPSQIDARGIVGLADRLTESLRNSGDLEIAEPSLSSVARVEDRDGDQIMFTAANQTQFTQSLLLFSQTQCGRRYTPSLTRFYAKLGPGILMPLICEALDTLGVKHRMAEKTSEDVLRIRVGGLDKRKLVFKGWIELEDFEYDGVAGSFCVMQRDQGNPISWRQLWKSIILSSAVEPHVYRKR
ncbi:hypothetical protein NM688_g4979 [Phlebia brevispora]|uniref:Uncharacterized protein n=1 Tax=Phlebia brevispora TaxID=194682 RepID=A0ACC1T1F9_9APHY|nr:hypothetical protein NM688_g4979 [Phlebia brevispora]